VAERALVRCRQGRRRYLGSTGLVSFRILLSMDIESIRKFCVALPGATEQIQWEDDLVFKVGGKMFAVVRLEPARVYISFKASAEDFAELVERPGIIPAPYLARAQWIALESESALRRTELEELLRRAHSLILAKLPKKLREKLLQPKELKLSSRSRKRKRAG
jgi:predicted DNA-binding protein (MmcQ/YjbR family)